MFLAGSQITMVGPLIVYWIYEFLIFFGYGNGLNNIRISKSQDQNIYLMSITFLVCHTLNFYVWYITFIPLTMDYITAGGINASSSYGKAQIVQRTCYDAKGVETDCIA